MSWNWSGRMPSDAGVLLCAHGSRDPMAVSECMAYFEAIKKRVDVPFRCGFLEFAQPVLGDALDAMVHQDGVKQIWGLPLMLLAAGHVKNDLPSVLNRWSRENRIPVRYGSPVGLTPNVITAACDRIRRSLDSLEDSSSDVLLLTVGRGTSDPDANADVYKLSRLLAEGVGAGWSEVCFSGVTFPTLKHGMNRCARMGFRQVVVYGHFLFTGVLVERIVEAIEQARIEHPSIQWTFAGYLGITQTSLSLINDSHETLASGNGSMNCQLCKYRTRIEGFEADVGQKQESHHHHVEGIGTGAADPKDHHHHHHHPPYIHAGHPFGPGGSGSHSKA